MKTEKKERGLYKRPNSPYWWIRYTDKHGNTIRESTGTREKSIAREILNKRRTEVAEGKFLDKKKTPKTKFHEVCELYWERRGQHLRMKGLESMIRIWKRQIVNKPVTSLNQFHIEDFLTTHFQDKAVSSRNRHISQLKATFNWAMENGLIENNPAAKIKKKREVGRNRYLTLEEIPKLLAACTKRPRQIIEFALNTGMRKGEILDLKWPDVNLKQRVIWVRTSEKGDPRHVPINEKVNYPIPLLDMSRVLSRAFGTKVERP